MGQAEKTSGLQDAARVTMGLMLATTGTSHLTFAREPFKAQVPPWVPLAPDTVVALFGVAELGLASTLLLAKKDKALVGKLAAAFFVAIFPGNIAQYRHHRDAFGLDTDGKRLARLFMQPVLVGWALWAGGVLGGKRRESDHR